MLDKIKNELQMIYSTKAQTQNGRRQTWLDMARGIAIILVVMGHRGFITERTNTWLSSFHLPLFFMVSGILLELKNEKDYSSSEFIMRKAKSLLIPYFIFSFCSMGLDFYFKPAGVENLIPDFKLHLFQTFTFQGYSVLWFLPVTFLAELIVFSVYKKCKLQIVTGITLLLSYAGYYLYKFVLLAVPELVKDFSRIIFKAFIAAAFMTLGILFVRIMEKFKDKNAILQFLIGAILFAINIVAAWHIELKDLNNLDLGYLTVYFILGVTGSSGLFLICKNCINIAPVTYFGRNSLIVFCTHLNCYVLYYGTIFYMHFYKHYNLPDIVNENVTANIYTMIFTFLLEIPVIFVINVFLPFMVGKINRKNNN